MSSRTDKNTLKQYFRSGSRPTQKQFHELIDSCYNSNNVFSSCVSGYEVLVDTDNNKTITRITREAGRTNLIPFFERINVVHRRAYHYAIPIGSVGSDYMLDKIIIEIYLPESSRYKVRDRSKEVNITQSVVMEEIKIYNGSEELYALTSGIRIEEGITEIMVSKSSTQWLGIGIDMVVAYDIKSDIAVSDQLDIAAESQNMLLHKFGTAGCLFISSE